MRYKDSNAGWKYLLTSITTTDYTDGGSTTTETIDYDAIGNPISYRGAAMAWRGRQLTGHTKNGVTSTFSYDADGLRSTKTVGGVKTEYQYVGDQLFYEKRGDSQEFYYFYDSYGNLSKIYYTFTNVNNNTTSRAIYHALTNAQGDVIALYNGSGTLVAQYEYDAWGNTLSIKNASGADITAWYNIAVANPIRYRGYYYDSDLGLYYLQSRYYDSTIGRFINADGFITTGQGVLSHNMYAYCNNNPVMFSDPSGYRLGAAGVVLGAGYLARSMCESQATDIVDSNDINYQANINRRPYTGKPGSTYTAPNGDKRTYNSDGLPERDYDHSDHGNPGKHPHDENGGHTHDWKDGVRGPAHKISWEPVIGVVLVTTCTIGIVYVVSNDVTGLGIMDDCLLAPIGYAMNMGMSLLCT